MNKHIRINGKLYEAVERNKAPRNIEDEYQKLFDELVPIQGKAKTVAGEIVRAFNRIGYRFLNDGDRIGIEYGKETCNAPARYLQDVIRDSKIRRQIDKMWGTFYKKSDIDKLGDMILDYLEDHPELMEKKNNKDMWDYYDEYEDVDNGDDEDEDYYDWDEEYV